MKLYALALITAPALVSAQAPQAPKPGPEQQKLAYFAGRWSETADMKPGPMGPGGKMTVSSSCEWFEGGFYLVCRSNGHSPTGPMQGLAILGYSAERQKYTYYGVDNAGTPAEPSYGTVTGDTWSWEGEATMGGQQIKSHYTIKRVSPDEYTWKWEMSVAGGPMTVMAEGTDKRVK